MKNLTAVEWLKNVIKEMVSNDGDLGEDYPALIKHFEQAKELEKEQIVDACDYGIKLYINDTITGQDYYDATLNQIKS